jgi:hypothetical protein
MASGKFRIKTSNEWNTIFYRFKQGNIFDIEISTGIKIPNKRWSNAKQNVLATIDFDFKGINEKLKELDSFIQKEFNNTKIAKSRTIFSLFIFCERLNQCYFLSNYFLLTALTFCILLITLIGTTSVFGIVTTFVVSLCKNTPAGILKWFFSL